MATVEVFVNEIEELARRCAQIIERWGGPEVDVGKHGLGLIADFATALKASVKPVNADSMPPTKAVKIFHTTC